MQVLYTTPYGSRLYGTQTETSDWDWKHIVLPELGDMLAGRQIKNKFYSSASDEVKNTSADTDTEYVPVQTFARHFFEGQAYAIEVAFGVLQRSKIEGTDLVDPRFLDVVNDLISKFLTNNVHAMVAYAYAQAQLYSDKGNRLEKLTDFHAILVKVVDTGVTVAEDKLATLMTFEPLVALTDKLFYVTEIPTAHQSLEPAIAVLEKMYPGSITVGEAITRVAATIKKYGKRANQAMENKGHDWKAISHAMRITAQVLYVLNNGHVPMPFSDELALFLIQIKQGLLEWEDVKRVLEKKMDEIAQAQLTTKLASVTPELRTQFEEWLTATMITLYGV